MPIFYTPKKSVGQRRAAFGITSHRNFGVKPGRSTPKNFYNAHTLTVRTVFFRIFLVLFTTVFIISAGLLGAVWIVEFGPSEKARDLFVTSVMETSAVKFLATSFLGQEKVDEILKANSMQASDDITDTDLVIIRKPDSKPNLGNNTPSGVKKTVIPGSGGQEKDPDGDGIDIVSVVGSTFNGKMMIVYDPTRVFVGASGNYGENECGKTVVEIYNSYNNVIAGINGGGWDDENGLGTGGIPLGMVISQGKVLWNPSDTPVECCGITDEGKLVVGAFTLQQAQDIGITDAVQFGPALIVNDNPTNALGSGGGLNPRTAIGQRADGAMLLLTIDGRTSGSLGASLRDVQDVMLKFEAVNAYNLDGGSSTSMLFHGKHVNINASVWGLRRMCTAFLVKEKEQ